MKIYCLYRESCRNVIKNVTLRNGIRQWSLQKFVSKLYQTIGPYLIKNFQDHMEKQPSKFSVKKGITKKGLPAFNFIENRLEHRCFPVNIAKFLRTPILKNECFYILFIQRCSRTTLCYHNIFLRTCKVLNIFPPSCSDWKRKR